MKILCFSIHFSGIETLFFFPGSEEKLIATELALPREKGFIGIRDKFVLKVTNSKLLLLQQSHVIRYHRFMVISSQM